MEKANAVKNTYALENFRITPIPSNGNLLVYLAEELTTPSKMLEGTPLEQIYKKDTVELYWKDKLPAVYNITVDALCTIVCPFFFFLNPFQKFYFKSRLPPCSAVSAGHNSSVPGSTRRNDAENSRVPR